jgi:hypothetical protein
MTYWDNQNRQFYKEMLKRHPDLWLFVENFIKKKKIDSVLEIGGGYSPVKPLVSKYLNIDLREECADVYGDFLKIDLTPYKGYDMVVAFAVVEHCDGYEEFIRRMYSLGTKHLILSFFHGLDRNEDYKKKIVLDGIEVFNNKYSKDKVIQFMEQDNITDYSLIKVGKDYIIIK